MSLDLSVFNKALDSLERTIKRSRRDPSDEEVRDSVIQRFGYSYELAWKMLKRQIEIDAPTPAEIDTLGYKELIRRGAEFGLIEDPEAWFEYRRQRNITAHTYDEKKAAMVYRAALDFYRDAQALLEARRRHNPAS